MQALSSQRINLIKVSSLKLIFFTSKFDHENVQWCIIYIYNGSLFLRVIKFMEGKYLSWELKLNLSTLLDLRGSVGYFHGGASLISEEWQSEIEMKCDEILEVKRTFLSFKPQYLRSVGHVDSFYWLPMLWYWVTI